MRDFLSQLALRAHQPDLAVQPRPLSRFESPRAAIFPAPALPVVAAPDEQGSQAAAFLSTDDANADNPTPQVSRRPRKDEETTGSLSASQRVPSRTPASPSASASQLLLEIASFPLYRQPVAEGRQIPQADGARIQPSVHIPTRTAPAHDIGISQNTMAALSQPPDESLRPTLSPRPTTRSAQVARSRGEQDAQRSVNSERLEEQAGLVSPVPLQQRGRAELQRSVPGREKEPIPPLSRIEKPEGQKTSAVLVHTTAHTATEKHSESAEAESVSARQATRMPKSGFFPTPGEDIFRPGTGPAAQHAMAERSSATPTIQVTIGHVEIRATVASPPARKPAPPSPVMSLDEYLKQRNGGRG